MDAQGDVIFRLFKVYFYGADRFIFVKIKIDNMAPFSAEFFISDFFIIVIKSLETAAENAL